MREDWKDEEAILHRRPEPRTNRHYLRRRSCPCTVTDLMPQLPQDPPAPPLKLPNQSPSPHLLAPFCPSWTCSARPVFHRRRLAQSNRSCCSLVATKLRAQE
jgi:hypothetical protein